MKKSFITQKPPPPKLYHTERLQGFTVIHVQYMYNKYEEI